MRDRDTQALLDHCMTWAAQFPNTAWEQAPRAAEGGRLVSWLSACPPQMGGVFSLAPDQWRALGDTGRGDTVAHASQVLIEHGFEHVLDAEVSPPDGRPLHMFLHPDGVLGQLVATPGKGLTEVRMWGCAWVRDWGLAVAVSRAIGPLRNGAHEIELSLGVASFSWAWLSMRSAVEWIAPWPEPVVRTWLGPSEPLRGNRANLSEAEATMAGHRTTNEILAWLPEHVHAKLGNIAQLY